MARTAGRAHARGHSEDNKEAGSPALRAPRTHDTHRSFAVTSGQVITPGWMSAATPDTAPMRCHAATAIHRVKHAEIP
jgi:hypothetical protein